MRMRDKCLYAAHTHISRMGSFRFFWLSGADSETQSAIRTRRTSDWQGADVGPVVEIPQFTSARPRIATGEPKLLLTCFRLLTRVCILWCFVDHFPVARAHAVGIPIVLVQDYCTTTKR